MDMPPCGLYRTVGPIGSIEAGRLVYFHNHGDPGPGVYLPEGWSSNRARFSSRGQTLPGPESLRNLEPLPAEGFYRVAESFYCCDKHCRQFEPDTLVQLGYNGSAHAILFLPELVNNMLAIPERGTPIDLDRCGKLRQLKVAVSSREAQQQQQQ